MSQENQKATASIVDAIAKEVSEYFERPNAKSEVYSTADGYIFENYGFAQNHAATLEDKNVTPHTNPSSIEVIDEEEVKKDLDDENNFSGPAATQNLK